MSVCHRHAACPYKNCGASGGAKEAALPGKSPSTSGKGVCETKGSESVPVANLLSASWLCRCPTGPGNPPQETSTRVACGVQTSFSGLLLVTTAGAGTVFWSAGHQACLLALSSGAAQVLFLSPTFPPVRDSAGTEPWGSVPCSLDQKGIYIPDKSIGMISQVSVRRPQEYQ